MAPNVHQTRLLCLRFALMLAMALPGGRASGSEISFSRHVQPILAEHCYQCHGPDENQRKARLRLDQEEGAMAIRKGGPILIPGHPERSPLIARIISGDPDEVMPPPEAKKKLERKEIAVLRQWVREGAKWGRHWSFEKPEW
ncbi:MAG TPA: c-type cytochrome domain-containing protein, partial [Verrucomicrobiae bacterium]|nr:c-type cytochrome domain-containing protein [Verrucomicrobiae bacterium]